MKISERERIPVQTSVRVYICDRVECGRKEELKSINISGSRSYLSLSHTSSHHLGQTKCSLIMYTLSLTLSSRTGCLYIRCMPLYGYESNHVMRTSNNR